jgi:hypothetical protein
MRRSRCRGVWGGMAGGTLEFFLLRRSTILRPKGTYPARSSYAANRLPRR